MIKSGEIEVDRHSRSLAPARPLASDVLRGGRAREEMSLVSSFRRLASCATESAGAGPGEPRRRPMAAAAEAGAGEDCPPLPSHAKNCEMWRAVGPTSMTE